MIQIAATTTTTMTTTTTTTTTTIIIKELDPRKVYKYLGIEESFDIQHKNEKEKLTKEYLRRLRLVLSTELSAKKKNSCN